MQFQDPSVHAEMKWSLGLTSEAEQLHGDDESNAEKWVQLH
jgi:hypothetical protein